MLFLPAALSLGCAIEDGTAFGAPYSIVASPLPRIDGSDVVFTATYSSPCDGGGSEFEVQRFTSEDGEDLLRVEHAIFVEVKLGEELLQLLQKLRQRMASNLPKNY